MDGGTWWAAVHGVAKSQTWMSDFTFTFHFHALEKKMATHSSVLAWRIPGMGEPGGLPSMGSHRVRHNWSDLAAAADLFSHVWMWELVHKEGWVPKNWCFWTVVLEKTLESSLNCKEIKLNPKGNQPWIIHWKDWCWSWSSNTLATWCEELTHWKSGKETYDGKDWGQKVKGQQRMRWLDGIIDSMDMSLRKPMR